MKRPTSPFETLLGQAGAHLGHAAKTLGRRLADATDPALWLQRSLMARIEIATLRYPLDPGALWSPGTRLRVLVVDDAGSGDVAADLRTAETLRQLRHLLGDDALELSVLTADPARTRTAFPTARQLPWPRPDAASLDAAIHDAHVVLVGQDAHAATARATARAALGVAALGLARAEHKLALGYGAHVDHLPPSLVWLLHRYAQDAPFFARDAHSIGRLDVAGLSADLGADTAWTYAPPADTIGRRVLHEAGWDGHAPVVALCPANLAPAPPAPSADTTTMLERALLGGAPPAERPSPVALARHEAALTAMADAAARLAQTRGVFLVVASLTPADHATARTLAGRLGPRVPCLTTDTVDSADLVSVLRQASALLSGREHALVATMPALVPSAALPADPQTRALFDDRGQPELALEADPNAAQLAERAFATLERLLDDADEVSHGIADAVVVHLGRMAQMGQLFVEHLRARHPEFHLRPELGLHGTPWDHLPPLPSSVERLLEGRTHG